MADAGMPHIKQPGQVLAPAAIIPQPTDITIDVELNQGIEPTTLTAPTTSPVALTAPGLASLRQVVRTHNVRSAVHTFARAARIVPVAPRALAADDLRRFVQLRFPSGTDPKTLLDDLRKHPNVKRAVLVPKLSPPSMVFDPLVGSSSVVSTHPATALDNQWYIFRCGIDRAWANATGKDVVIADVDWGLRATHQDLAPKLESGRTHNSVDGGTNVAVGNFITHGTAVLGIAAGAKNGQGIMGIAFDASIWPIQANEGTGVLADINSWASGIDWAVQADSGGRRKVIIVELQADFGNCEMLPSINHAVLSAIAAGAVVCVAAGNGDRDVTLDNEGQLVPPTGSILIGATEYDPVENRRASFSNFGTTVVVCAPGDPQHDVTCSIDSDSAYQNAFGGTSGATPKVAATVALMLQVNPHLTHAEVREILRSTGQIVVTDAQKPIGSFLDADAAVREAIARLTHPLALAPTSV